MNQLFKPLSDDLKLCEGVGCDRKATITTEISAGKFGIIILNLCNDCTVKFE